MTILDLSYLVEITDGEPGVMTEMIQLVVDETPRQLEDIRSSIEQEQWEKVRAEAHKVKPIFLYVGLNELNQKMQEIEEQAGGSKDLNTVKTLIGEIEETFNEILPQLIKRMEDISG
ncbi:Hpt domain-containing protein [Balneola sp. MJW-20]|uniref:Hpt domain-containing protein n=1 Tax=Gracilimonas aurantiaca TaxID=3234185 RepID=UPI003466B3C8